MKRNQEQIHGLPDFDPFSRKTLGQQAYDAVKDALMSGRFSPGQKLTIRGLAQQMGASPMPIREALQRLLAEKALHSTVTNRILVPELTVEQLRELREARIALEGLLVEKAANVATAADCKEIASLHERMCKAVDINDKSGYLFANFAFHRRIYQIAKADLTLRVVESFWLLMGPSFVLLTPTKTTWETAVKTHSRLLRAVIKKDGAAARQAVADDITLGMGKLESIYTAAGSSTASPADAKGPRTSPRRKNSAEGFAHTVRKPGRRFS